MIIKNKTLYLVIGLLSVLLLSACTSSMTSSSTKHEYFEPYRVALDELMTTDKALNDKMEYISLVFNKEVPFSDTDKQAIEEYLQKEYKVDIYNYNYEELIENKLSEQNGTRLKGILLTIEKQETTDNSNEMIIEVSKYRANQGAIAFEMIVAQQEGQWKVGNYVTIRES